MLNDCIHRDKMYILALEESVGQDIWPTGEPGEAKVEYITQYLIQMDLTELPRRKYMVGSLIYPFS